MTPKISLNKSAISIFLFTLKKCLGFSAIGAVLAFLLSPVYMYNTIADYVEKYKKLIYNYEDIFTTFAIIAAVAATAFLMVLLYINFSYLYKRSAGDFFQALPLKRSELLFSRFFGCFVAAIIPLFVGYAGAFGLTFLDYVSADRGKIVIGFVFTVAMMLALGFFTLLFILASGGIFDSIIALCAVNIGIPIIALFVYGLCSQHLYGFSSNIDTEIIAYTTPFGYALMRLVYLIADYSAAPFFEWKHVIAALVLIVGFAALAVLLYNRRKSEKTDGSYAFKFVPEVIGAIVSVLGIFVFALIFSSEYDEVPFWCFGFIGALLASVVYHLIINRGFKKIVKSLIVGVAAFLVLLAVNFGIQFDIFGWENNFPIASSVENVEVRLMGYSMKTQDVDLALKLNKAIVEDKDIDKGDNDSAQYIYFTYNLKNGKKIKRSYDVKYLAAAKEKVELINKELPEAILEEYDEIKPYQSYDWSYSKYNNRYSTDHNTEYKVSNKKAEEIVNAYANDIKTVGLEFFDNETEDATQTIYLGKSVKIGQVSVEVDGGMAEYTDYKDYNLYIHNYTIYPSVAEVINSLVKDEDLSKSYVDEKMIEHHIIYYK